MDKLLEKIDITCKKTVEKKIKDLENEFERLSKIYSGNELDRITDMIRSAHAYYKYIKDK